MDRNAISRPQQPAQSASEMLKIFEKAKLDAASVTVGPLGQIQIAEERIPKAKVLFLNLVGGSSDPGRVLHNKMIAEIAQLMNGDQREAERYVEQHVGTCFSINRAINDGNPEWVRDAWENIKVLQVTNKNMAIYKKREEMCQRLQKHLLPELKLSMEDNNISKARLTMDESRQQAIIDVCRSCHDLPLDPKSGMAHQFNLDKNRSTLSFVFQDGRSRYFSPGHGDQAAESLLEFSNHDQAIARNLSKSMNQTAALALMAQSMSYFPGKDLAEKPVFVAAPGYKPRSAEESQYEAAYHGDDQIIMTTHYYRGGQDMYLSDGKTYPINRWPGWESMPVGPENFVTHCKTSVIFNIDDLRNDEFKPQPWGLPEFEVQLMIDWETMGLPLAIGTTTP